MDLKQIEKFWINGSKEAYDTAKVLYQKKKYTDSMFYLHLSIEKMLKALYVNHLTTEAPWGHNLQTIALKITDLCL